MNQDEEVNQNAIPYRMDLPVPDGWSSTQIDGRSVLLQPEHPERFVADGLVPSVLAMAEPGARPVELVGTTVEHLRRSDGESEFDSYLCAGSDGTTGFFQVVSITRTPDHQLVVTATAAHGQAPRVAEAFAALTGTPLDFAPIEEEPA